MGELTVDEGALLASLPKAPSHYSPANDIERAEQRRNTVLAVMERHGFLTAEETVLIKEGLFLRICRGMKIILLISPILIWFFKRQKKSII
nr:transglycosylase domain-containing protein [Thalassobacillus sp. C254]